MLGGSLENDKNKELHHLKSNVWSKAGKKKIMSKKPKPLFLIYKCHLYYPTQTQRSQPHYSLFYREPYIYLFSIYMNLHILLIF